MIYLTEVTKDWVVQGGWLIAPAGVPWIKEGHRIQVGEYSDIGEDVHIGDRVDIGDGVHIGDQVDIRHGVHIGDGVHISDGVSISSLANIVC